MCARTFEAATVTCANPHVAPAPPPCPSAPSPHSHAHTDVRWQRNQLRAPRRGTTPDWRHRHRAMGTLVTPSYCTTPNPRVTLPSVLSNKIQS